MSLSLSTQQSSHSSPSRRSVIGLSIVVAILLLLGGGGWYYFFGQKPKVAFTVPLKKTQDFTEGRSWPIGDGSKVAVLAAGELKLCSLTEQKVLWTAKVPALKEVDPAWQDSLNNRFVRLQEWAASLTTKRASLTTQPAIKAFNEEAAKYQAELLATRSDAAKPPPLKAKAAGNEDAEEWPEEVKLPAPGTSMNIKDRVANTRAIATHAAAQTEAAQKVGTTFLPKHATAPAVPVAPAAKVPDFSGRSTTPQKLNPAISPEIRILQGRIEKRKAALADMDSKIVKKTRAAKTPLALGEVQELQTKRAALAAEQQAEETEVARALGTSTPAPAAKPIPTVPALVAPGKTGEPTKAAPTPAASVAEAADESDDDSFSLTSEGPPQLAELGDRIWLIEGPRALSFSIADGTLKEEARLSGNVSRVFPDDSAVFVVADAGSRARQITKIDPAGTTQSIYLAAPPRELAFSQSLESGYRVNIQTHRVEFTGAAGSVARADIRLVARKTKVRDLIKPGTEKKLEETIGKSTGNSTDEILAISKLMEADNMRAYGNAKEEVDESTYEVTLTRPFEPAVPAWKGTLQGRIQVLSTPTLDLVTAGTKLIAVDRANKQVWETTLGAPMPQRGDDSAWEDAPLPLLEEGGRLFFADGAFLTAIQAGSGQVLWRMPNVGIRKILSDADSNLYVQTDNLGVDTLSYVTSADTAPATSSTLKVNPEDGKVLWTAEKFENVWVSGKDVYTFRHILHGGDAENQVFDPASVPEARIKIYKLARGSGKPTWDWYQSRRPRNVIAHGKYVAILFGDELQVIHSIAL